MKKQDKKSHVTEFLSTVGMSVKLGQLNCRLNRSVFKFTKNVLLFVKTKMMLPLPVIIQICHLVNSTPWCAVHYILYLEKALEKPDPCHPFCFYKGLKVSKMVMVEGRQTIMVSGPFVGVGGYRGKGGRGGSNPPPSNSPLLHGENQLLSPRDSSCNLWVSAQTKTQYFQKYMNVLVLDNGCFNPFPHGRKTPPIHQHRA